MNFSRFSALTKAQKENLTLKDFTVSEIKEIIAETALKDEDAAIATLRFINCKTIESIAERQGFDSRTITRRIRKIEKLLKETIQRII